MTPSSFWLYGRPSDVGLRPPCTLQRAGWHRAEAIVCFRCGRRGSGSGLPDGLWEAGGVVCVFVWRAVPEPIKGSRSAAGTDAMSASFHPPKHPTPPSYKVEMSWL